MLTARVEDVDKIPGREMVAYDYLTKSFNPREVLARGRAILRRATLPASLPPRLLAGQLWLDIDRHLLKVRMDLTPAELFLLQVLMENPDHVYTGAELIGEVLGYTCEGLERTLDLGLRGAAVWEQGVRWRRGRYDRP